MKSTSSHTAEQNKRLPYEVDLANVSDAKLLETISKVSNDFSHIAKSVQSIWWYYIVMMWNEQRSDHDMFIVIDQKTGEEWTCYDSFHPTKWKSMLVQLNQRKPGKALVYGDGDAQEYNVALISKNTGISSSSHSTDPAHIWVYEVRDNDGRVLCKVTHNRNMGVSEEEKIVLSWWVWWLNWSSLVQWMKKALSSLFGPEKESS